MTPLRVTAFSRPKNDERERDVVNTILSFTVARAAAPCLARLGAPGATFCPAASGRDDTEGSAQACFVRDEIEVAARLATPSRIHKLFWIRVEDQIRTIES